MEEILNGNILPETFFPIEKLQNYVHLGVVHNYNRGATIVHPDEIIGRIIYVLSGRVEVNMISDDGREIFIYSAGQYSILDRLFSFKDDNARIIAVQNSKVCFFSKEQLLIVFEKEPEIIFDFLRNSDSKIFYYMKQTKNISLYNSSQRVFSLIYELCDKKGSCTQNYSEIKIKLSQKRISEITGVHHVTVCKLFAWLRQANIVFKTNNEIIVNDMQKLRELIEGKYESKIIFEKSNK